MFFIEAAGDNDNKGQGLRCIHVSTPGYFFFLSLFCYNMATTHPSVKTWNVGAAECGSGLQGCGVNFAGLRMWPQLIGCALT